MGHGAGDFRGRRHVGGARKVTADYLLIANSCATWTMVGVILFVHRVHYPLFDRYSVETFTATEASHQSRTFGVVFPPMILELATSLALLYFVPRGVPAWQPWAGAMLVGIGGFSTALVQIKLHEKLGAGFDATLHKKLVSSNRVRVAAWAAHGILCVIMLTARLDAATD